MLIVIDKDAGKSLKFNDIVAFGTINSAHWVNFTQVNNTSFVYGRVRGRMSSEDGREFTIIEPLNIDGVENPVIKIDKDGNKYSYILTTAILKAPQDIIEQLIKKQTDKTKVENS
jgi:hypothetical protein